MTDETPKPEGTAEETFWEQPEAAPGQGREWVTQLQQMIEQLATQAAPVIREAGAKAAELAALAGEKAGPVAPTPTRAGSPRAPAPPPPPGPPRPPGATPVYSAGEHPAHPDPR